MKVKKSQTADSEWVKWVVRKVRTNEDLRQREIAEKIGVNWQYFSGVANGRYPLTDAIRDKLFYQFPYLSNDEAGIEDGSSATTEGVPLYNVEASANLVSLFSGQERQEIVGQISIPNVPKCDGAIYVRGDSMAPLLKSGDIVAYKGIPNELSSIVYGEMYIVDVDLCGDEYVAVKFIHRGDKGEDWVKLSSYNPFYEPKEVHLSQVRSLALVKFSIRMNTMI